VNPQLRRLAARWAPWSVVGLIVVFGAWTRWSGFTSASLWFDDAWSALPARVGLATAVRMITTDPGYLLALRSWLQLDPNATWWAQLPAFVAGLAGIVAVYALLSYFRVWWPLRFLGALVIAASPVASDYSTRVKQFGFELLFACLLLWLAERWRREPAPRRAVALACACAAAMLFSVTTLSVALAVTAVAALSACTDRARRAGAAVVVGASGATLVVSYVLWLRHLSASLNYGWTRHGYLLWTSSLHHVVFSFEAMGTGIFHYLVGTPLGRSGRLSTQVTAEGIALALVAAVILATIVAFPLVGLVRSRLRAPGPFASAAIAVVFAVALALAARSPFGGGRTDEVLYPAILLLATGAVSSLVSDRGAAVRRVAMVVVVGAAACLVAVGATNRASYPETDLRPLVTALDRHLRPGEVVVVDPWLTFTWAYDQLTPTGISFAPTYNSWSQGFHVVSLDRDVDISVNYFSYDGSYAELSRRTHLLWYVTPTVGPQSPIPNHPNDLEETANYKYLKSIGWRRAGVYLTAPHTEAILMVYEPGRASSSR
jgi:hypothetical protein